jgi:biopolymer transport protein ExbB
VAGQAEALGRRFSAWYRATPPADRITWGALAACAALGSLTLLERSARVRRGRVVPRAFRDRFRARLAEGKLDWAKGLDYCELNPSPASRVALAALRRWGRPAPDLDRAVAIARQAESDRLRRHVGTLRRVAALAPLIGLLGSLVSASRALAALPAGAAWGPAASGALAPLTAGVGLAILALVAYDGLMGRVETLVGELDRIGAEVVDAVAPSAAAPPAAPRAERVASAGAQVRAEPAARPRAPHGPRPVEIAERFAREVDRDAEV